MDFDFKQHLHKIETAEIALFDVALGLREAKRLLAEMELAVKAEVCLEQNPNGKPVYSNDTLREVEATKRLAEDVAYWGRKQEVDDLEREKVKAAAQLESLRYQLKLALIDYELEKLGRRTALMP